MQSVKFLEEHFTCPICLDVMKDPATTQCGHNFCIDCISRSNNECAVCRNFLGAGLTINYGLKTTIEAMKKELAGKNQPQDIQSNKYKTAKKCKTNWEEKPSIQPMTSMSEKPNKYRVKRLFSEINLQEFNKNENETQNENLNQNSATYNNNSFLSNLKDTKKINQFLDKVMLQFKNINDFSNASCFPTPTQNNFSGSNININIYNVMGNHLMPNQQNMFYSDAQLDVGGYQIRKKFKRE